jgi:hypothetical protein
LSLSFVSVLQALLGEGAAGDEEEEEAEEEEINLHAAASDGECSSRTVIDGMGVSCSSYGLGRLVAGCGTSGWVLPPLEAQLAAVIHEVLPISA